MGISQARTKVKFLKNLDKLDYKCNQYIPVDKLEIVISRYVLARKENIISDFVVVPGDIGTLNNYQIYIKKRTESKNKLSSYLRKK